jgi:uncharacterized Tic20 family protein
MTEDHGWGADDPVPPPHGPPPGDPPPPYGGPSYGGPSYGGTPPGAYGGPPPQYGPGPYPPPYGPQYGQHPGMAPDDPTWALLAYLGQFVVGFIAPLVVYLARRDSPFARFHGAQALNLTLTYLIAVIGAFVLGAIGAFFAPLTLVVVIPVGLAFVVAHFVYLIVGAVKAGRREMGRLPTWICWPIVH